MRTGYTVLVGHNETHTCNEQPKRSVSLIVAPNMPTVSYSSRTVQLGTVASSAELQPNCNSSEHLYHQYKVLIVTPPPDTITALGNLTTLKVHALENSGKTHIQRLGNWQLLDEKLKHEKRPSGTPGTTTDVRGRHANH